MEAKAKAGEEDLSMEEILHSIRKIIAEDGEETTIPAKPEEDGKEDQVAGSDVLELTDTVEEPAGVSAGEEKPAAKEAAPEEAEDPSAANDDVLNKIDQVLAPEQEAKPVAKAPASAPAAASQEITPEKQAYIDSLLSKEAASATQNAFKRALPEDGPIPTTPSVPLRNGSTVEDLVMESLKPMLKDWLDQNLPTIVERIVEREVRKLTH